MQWRAGTVVDEVHRWRGAVEYVVALDGRHRDPRARPRVHRDGGRARDGRAGAPQRVGPAQGPRYRVASPSSWPAPTTSRPTPPQGRDTSSRRATRPCSRCCSRSTSRTARTTPSWPRRRPRGDAGGRRRPALGAPGGRGRHPVGARGRAGRVRHDRRWSAARGLLAGGRGALGCRVAGGDGHRRPGVRRRPRGRDDAHRPARGPARRRRRRGGRRAGSRQRRHRDPLGLLRRGLRRRPARRRGARGSRGGVPARLGGRPPRAAPRDQPPQPHGVRAGAAHPGRRAGDGAGRSRPRRPGAHPARRARPHRPSCTSPSSRCPPTDCSPPWARRRWGCRRWAGAWTRTPPRSSSAAAAGAHAGALSARR